MPVKIRQEILISVFLLMAAVMPFSTVLRAESLHPLAQNFSAQNITIDIPPTILNVNVTVPATNPSNGTTTMYSTEMNIPVNAMEFNITLPASVSYAIYNALNQSLNQSVLYGVFSTSLNSALPAAVNQTTNATAIKIAKSYVNPLSTSLSTSLSYTLPTSMASVLPKAIAVSLGASLSSALYNNLPPTLSQSLSQSLSKVIPIVAASSVNYIKENTATGTSGPSPTQVSSYIASILNSNLSNTMKPILAKTLSSSINTDLKTSLKTSIPTALETAGLQSGISLLINQSMASQLNKSISQSSGSAISNGTITSLSKNITSSISATLSAQLSNDLSSQLTSQLSSSLASQVSQNLGTGIAAYTSQDFSSNMGTSLEQSLPTYFGSGYPGGYLANPYQFGTALGTAPIGVPYTQTANGTYMVTAVSPQYMNAGQLSYILMDQMPSLAGRSSAGLGAAIGAAAGGLTPYSAMIALQTALPVAVPGAISSSVAYTLGAELGPGLNSGQLLGIGTSLAAYSGSSAAAFAPGALSMVQAGVPGTSYGSLVEAAGAASGNMGLIAAGSMMGGYSLGGIPGLAMGIGASTGSSALMDTAVLGGEYYGNVNAGYFALSAASMLGYGNYAVPASYALAALQGGGNLGTLSMAVGMLSGSSRMIQAGYALSLLQGGANPLLAAGALTGSSALETAGGALALLQGGTTLGNGLTYAGAYSGSPGLMGSGELMNMYGTGGTVGTGLGAAAGYNGGVVGYGAMGVMSGNPYAAGLAANGGYGTALEAFSGLQSGLLNAPTTAAFELNLGNLPVGITAMSGLNGGTSADLGLTTGYGTLLGGVLPVTALSSVNFILPQTPVGGIPDLSTLLPGIPGLGGLLNAPLPDINQYIPGLGFGPGFGLPGVGSCIVAVACEGIQSLLGPLPDLQGMLPGLPNGLLSGIPGLDLSNFNIPGLNLGSLPGFGLGNILSGYGGSTTFGAGGVVSGTVGGNVGIGGATLTSGLNIDIGRAMSKIGISNNMIGAIGSTVGYASAALNAYYVLSNFGSSIVTVTGVGSVSTPFNANQSIGSSLIVNPGSSSGSQPVSSSSSSSSGGVAVAGLHARNITVTSNVILNNQLFQQSGTVGASAASSVAAQQPSAGGSLGVSTNFNQIPQQQTISVSSPYQQSPATQVALYNENSSQWFLTCPTAPVANPTNDLFFEANQGMNIAGDACIATGGTLNTVISISTTIQTNSPCIPLPSPSAISNPLQAEAAIMSSCVTATVQPLTVQNPGVLTLQMLTYSPEIDGQLSNGFSTDSYIFQQVPSMAQHAIWTWNVEYSNFSKASASNSYQDSGLLLTTGYCTWSYSYHETTSLASMSNNYIPFNELTTFSGRPAVTMQNMQVPGAIQPSISGVVGSSGVGTVIGSTQSVGGTTGCIASGGSSINGQCIDVGAGGAGDLPYTGNSLRPDNNTFLRTSYQPISGATSSGSQSIAGSLASSTGITTLPASASTFGEMSIGTNVLPLLYFNYSLALTPAVQGSTQGLVRQSESIYSPWTYYTPNYSIDEFPIDIPGVVLFNNSLNAALSYLPQNGSGISAFATSNPVLYYTFVSSGGVTNPSPLISPATGTPTTPIPGSLIPGTSSQSIPMSAQSLPSATPSALNACPSDSVVLTRSQAVACAQQAGFVDTGNTPTTLGLDTVVAISQAESSLNAQNIHNNGKLCTGGANVGQESLDVGIMQINNCAHPDQVSCTGTTFSSCTGSATTVLGSFQDAYVLSSGGTNFNPWCTYGPTACGGAGNSAYCQYMPAGDPCESGGTGAGLVAVGGGVSTPPYLSQMSAYGITNPISMTSPGNGYVYVLFQNPNQNNAYEIAIVKDFPRGYFNASNVPIPPLGTSNAECSSESTCQATWNQTWSNYWYNVMNVQSYQSYIVNIIPLTNLYNAANSGITVQSGTTVTQTGTTSSLPTNPQTSGTTIIQAPQSNLTNKSYNLTFQSASASGSTASYASSSSSSSASGGAVSITVQNSAIQYPQTTTITGYCTPSTDPCYIEYPLGTILAQGTGEVSYSTPAGLPAGAYVYYVSDPATGQSGTATVTVSPGTPGQCQTQIGVTNNYLSSSCNFVPYNISSDANGDIFITGHLLSSFDNFPQVVKVANVLVNGGICPPTASYICDQFSISNIPTSSASSYPPFTEIASSPSGSNIYLASPNYGGILVFSGANLAYLNTIPLTFGQVLPGGSTALAGSASQQSGLSSQTSSLTTTPGYTAVLNIAYWLNKGGLFNYSIALPTSQSGSVVQTNDLDQPSNHHPLALADINGYLYVLDNWQGQLASGTNFNILMLRAINSTGASVPIDPTMFNDVFSQSTCSSSNLDTSACYTGGTNVPPAGACSAGCVAEPDPNSPCGGSSTAYLGDQAYTNVPNGYNYKCVTQGYGLSNTYYSLSTSLSPKETYPPYGWIISATIGSSASFCGTGSCIQTQSPINPSAYYATGPQLTSTYCYGTPEVQSTISTVIHKISGFFNGCGGGISMSANQNGTVAIFMPSTNPEFGGQSELLISRFNLENYTKFNQGTPPFTCYTVSGGGLCNANPNIQNMKPPVYVTGDPFFYAENQGSQQVLSYANQYYSQFTGGSGIPENQFLINQGGSQTTTGTSSSSTIQSQSLCAGQLQQFQSPTQCVASGQSGILGGAAAASSTQSQNLAQAFQSSSTSYLAQAQGNKPSSSMVLSSRVSGEALIGYKYTYELSQTFYNFVLSPASGCHATVLGCSICIGAGEVLSHMPPNIQTQTVYSYSPTPEAYSSYLSANVEGGDTYLEYGGGSNYYIQNLSDYGLFLSHHILMNATSNRLFTNSYVADENQGGVLYMLNAMQQLQFLVQTFTRAQQSYQTITSAPVGAVADSGPQYSPVSIPVSPTYSNFTFALAYSQPPSFGTVSLFDWYKAEKFADSVSLFIPNITGYNRLIFAFVDRFNNTIFAPIDADIAHITSISLNTSDNVNFQNPNQTSLTITGVAGEDYYNSTNITVQNFQPLSGADIYLYIGKDMNYVDANGGIIGPQQAQLCAFGSPTSPYLQPGTPFPTTCSQANPMWTGKQAGAENVSFSVPSSCGPPPQSLLNSNPSNCNIYGAFGLPSLCPSSGATQPYCIPSYINGTGRCTSQYGFMGTASTNANGTFTYTTNACGIGQVYVEAAYYGDSVQPITVFQPPLVGSVNSIIGAFPAAPTSFNAINYNWAPNDTSAVTSIGLFELGFGNLSGIGIVVIAAVAVSIILYRRQKSRPRRRAPSRKGAASNKRRK